MFDAAGSSDEEGISAYAWELGDGAITSGVSTTHQYAVPGTYTILLTVTDTDGAVDYATTTAVISVAPPPPTASAVIDLSREDSIRGHGVTVSRAIATVTVTADGMPLKGAIVYGHWSGAIDETMEGYTNGGGAVTFRTDHVPDAEVFTFTIDAIEKDGVIYQLQGDTSASI